MRNLAAVAVLVVGLLLARHNGAILVAALVIAWLVAGPGGTSAAGAAAGRAIAVRGHAHGHGTGTRRLIATHEAGHAVAARALGGQVTNAWMTDDEGLVQARIPDDPKSAVTFLLAGQYAAGTGRGASWDNAQVRRELRQVPSGDRGAVHSAAKRAARRIVSSRSGEIRRDARKLNEKGRL